MRLANYTTAAEPEPRPDPTPAEYYQCCTHQGACARIYELWVEKVDTKGHFGWMDYLAEKLGCGEDCEMCDFGKGA